ncbi:MAG: sodium:solute symporter family protein [Gammaproteobacteria bacterium]|nr:sodium:solute symporter family protein [Gammaproteobacteria bacterium]
MTFWLLVIGGVYGVTLVVATIKARQASHNSDDYVMAGSNVGVVLGFLTFGATLFSTFTLMGMPDFFRTHGIGAWIFLAVSDAAVAFVVLWFGSKLRRRVSSKDFKGMAGLMRDSYKTPWAGYLYFATIFIFLTPYVAIQIRGISIFLNAAFPLTLPDWGWAASIVVVMLIYSEIGGLKAIIYSDALQGILLLVVTWVIAYGCVQNFGSIQLMFDSVREVNPALLSTPGPKGLFNTQFLLASFLVILFLPLTQPQLATRMIIMRDMQSMQQMAIALGIFAIAVILPTVAIGMYGAVHYADVSASEFLAQVLLHEQAPALAACVAVGLVAAAMSTSDSQLFALGTELRSLLSGKEKTIMIYTRLAIVCFAGLAFLFAIMSSEEMVLLARVSFTGTALVGPMILTAVLTRRKLGSEILILTATALALFLISLSGLIPTSLLSIRLELLLLLFLTIFISLSVLCRKSLELKTVS